MPCDTYRATPEQTLAQRMAEVKATLKRLEQALLAGQVKVAVAGNGAVAFTGWTAAQRIGVTDVCAYRTLAAENSWALRQAVARAEAQSGKRVNPQAVAAGFHSHDGGATWSKH